MSELSQIIKQHLKSQGLEDLAEELSSIIKEDILTWKLEEEKNTDMAAYIIGFAFGFYLEPNGNKNPGKINKSLAEALLQYYAKKPRPVITQWEIGVFLTGIVEEEHLHIIHPRIDPKTGATMYLSTKNVLEALKRILSVEKTNSPILIIAHHDHLPRCMSIARRMGFKVFHQQSAMPKDYDMQSAQYWTRSKKVYLISDMISRLASRREDL